MSVLQHLPVQPLSVPMRRLMVSLCTSWDLWGDMVHLYYHVCRLFPSKKKGAKDYSEQLFPSSVVASDGTSYAAVFITESMARRITRSRMVQTFSPWSHPSLCGCRRQVGQTSHEPAATHFISDMHSTARDHTLQCAAGQIPWISTHVFFFRQG